MHFRLFFVLGVTLGLHEQIGIVGVSTSLPAAGKRSQATITFHEHGRIEIPHSAFARLFTGIHSKWHRTCRTLADEGLDPSERNAHTLPCPARNILTGQVEFWGMPIHLVRG